MFVIRLMSGNIREVNCSLEEFSIISEAVPGGDGWLGQCFDKGKVRLVHDWRFKSLPPVAFSPNMLPHITSFHKVLATVQTMLHPYAYLLPRVTPLGQNK